MVYKKKIKKGIKAIVSASLLVTSQLSLAATSPAPQCTCGCFTPTAFETNGEAQSFPVAWGNGNFAFPQPNASTPEECAAFNGTPCYPPNGGPLYRQGSRGLIVYDGDYGEAVLQGCTIQ